MIGASASGVIAIGASTAPSSPAGMSFQRVITQPGHMTKADAVLLGCMISPFVLLLACVAWLGCMKVISAIRGARL